MNVERLVTLPRAGLVTLALAVAAAQAALAQQTPPPALELRSILNEYYGEDGLISFGQYDLVFAPQGQVEASVDVFRLDGTRVASFPFFPDYRFADKVFGKLQIVGPADVQLTEPGDYQIQFNVAGEVAARLPFTLQQIGAGDDPFDPDRRYHFEGPWRAFAYLTLGESQGVQTVEVSFWTSGQDLPEGETRDQPLVELFRGGTLIAHSQPTVGIIAAGPYAESSLALFRPHEEKDAHLAEVLPLQDLLVDGDHELVLSRQSDGQRLRRFTFQVAGGKITPHPRTVLGYQPRYDYIPPRVVRKGSTAYEFQEAIWIEDAGG